MRKKSKKKKEQKVENKKTYANLPKSAVREEINLQFHYQVGHFVVVKNGVMDPDYGIDIGGWKGKIYDIQNGEDSLLSIKWDDETLNKMPNSIIKACKKDNLDHATMSLYASDVESVSNKTLLTTITKNDNEMFLNINSFERATKAIVFFDKYFPRNVAKVNDITILNKVFDSFDGNLFKHEEYFDQEPIKIKDTEKIFNELTDAVSSINDPMEKIESVLMLLRNKSKEPFPEVERFLIYFYEEGITSLETTLTTRETIALEHWRGNKDYSFSDLYQKIVSKMPPLDL